MASIILTENHEIYLTREFIYKEDKTLHDELKIKKYSIFIEWINLNFNEIEENLFQIIDNDENYKLLYKEIKNNLDCDGFLKNKFKFANKFSKLLGNSINKLTFLSTNSISIITYFINSFFFSNDIKIKEYFTDNSNLQNIVKLFFDELKNSVNFIKKYYEIYKGIIDYNKFKFIFENCFDIGSDIPDSKIIIQAFFNDKEINEFLETYKHYHKNIDFYHKKMLETKTDENTIKYKIVNACYTNKHAKNIPQNKTIYDLGLNFEEMIEYFQLIYSYQYELQSHKLSHFSTFQKYFEIIIFDFLNNNQRIKKCPNCNKFFIINKGKKGNNQKYCTTCKELRKKSNHNSIEPAVIIDARKFNDKYGKKFKNNLKKDFADLENFASFTTCLKDNILKDIKKDALTLAHKIYECDDCYKKVKLENIYKNWKTSNDQIYTRKYIFKQYAKSELSDPIKNKNIKMELQYYKLDSNFTMKLKTITIDIERTIERTYDSDRRKEIIEYKILDEKEKER